MHGGFTHEHIWRHLVMWFATISVMIFLGHIHTCVIRRMTSSDKKQEIVSNTGHRWRIFPPHESLHALIYFRVFLWLIKNFPANFPLAANQILMVRWIKVRLRYFCDKISIYKMDIFSLNLLYLLKDFKRQFWRLKSPVSTEKFSELMSEK